MNAQLIEKRDLITSVLLCRLPLLALQLFCRLVLLLFLILDSPLVCRPVLDLPLVCCLFLLVLEPLLFCCLSLLVLKPLLFHRLILCLLRFLHLQLFCHPFLCSVQLFLILHLQLSKHSNKPCQRSFCAIQPALQSTFIRFRLSTYYLTKPTTSGLLIQHFLTLAHLPAIMFEKRLTWALRNAVAPLQSS